MRMCLVPNSTLVHVCVSTPAFNQETAGETISCIAIFYLDTAQDVVPTLYDKRVSPTTAAWS